MTNAVPPAPRTVRLVDVPVGLYRRAQQHTDDILRELVLMADHEAANGGAGPVAGLARRAGDHHEDRARQRVEAAPAIDGAHERGEDSVTLTYRVDAGAVASSEAWSAVLDELDGLCRAGTLLTVPAAPDVALFSRWFCAEFVSQLRDGRPPCPWPHFVRDAHLASR